MAGLALHPSHTLALLSFGLTVPGFAAPFWSLFGVSYAINLHICALNRSSNSLTESHTGDYMVERMHDCLRRFGIEDKVWYIFWFKSRAI